MTNEAYEAMLADPRQAYLEWLRMEAQLLQIELYLEMDAAAQFSPCGTFAKKFHFPPGGDWRDVPKPSTRAAQMLKAAGVQVAA